MTTICKSRSRFFIVQRLVPAVIAFILLLALTSQALAEWGENVELINYPIRQKIPIGVIEDGLLYGDNSLGLQILDVSDPVNMTEIAFLPLPFKYPYGNMGNSQWIAFNQGYVYLRARTPAGVDSFDVYIIDVRNPHEPVVARQWETGQPNDVFWVHNGFLYYQGPNRLTRYDLSDPVNPREMDSISPWRSTFYMAFTGDYLIGGGDIIDISGDRMALRGGFPYMLSLSAQDTLIAVIADSLILYEFDPPDHVTRLCDTLMGTAPRMTGNYWINGRTLYLAPTFDNNGQQVYGGIIQAVDISNPRRPAVIGQHEFLDDEGNPLQRELFAREGNTLFFTEGEFCYTATERLQALDVQNPRRMRLIGEIATPHVFIDNTFLDGTRIYLNMISVRFRWNMTGPYDATYLSCYPKQNDVGGYMIGGMFSLGDLVYSSQIVRDVWSMRGTDSYLRVIDYSIPESPAPLYDTPSELSIPVTPDMPPNRLIDDRYWLMVTDGVGSLVDLTDHERPRIVLQIQGLPDELSVISNEYAIGKSTRTLELWSLADLFHPQLADRDSIKILRSIAVKDDIVCAFIRDTTSSFQPLTFRINSEARRLDPIGRGEAVGAESGGKYGSIITEGDLAVLTCNNGFLVWDLSDPVNPHLVGSHLSCSSNCGEVFATGDSIILNDVSGIGWFKMKTAESRPSFTLNRELPLRTPVGSSDTLLLSISNESEAGLLHITSLTLTGNRFEVAPFGQWIKPLETWERQILFKPGDIAHYAAELTIHTAEGEPIVVELTGDGVEEAARLVDPIVSLVTNLLPCCPNPVNSMTTISFNLSSDAHVRFELFDLQGRRLKTIRTRDYQHGQYQFAWNASELTSGLYILRMVAERRSFLQRMVIVR